MFRMFLLMGVVDLSDIAKTMPGDGTGVNRNADKSRVLGCGQFQVVNLFVGM